MGTDFWLIAGLATLAKYEDAYNMGFMTADVLRRTLTVNLPITRAWPCSVCVMNLTAAPSSSFWPSR